MKLLSVFLKKYKLSVVFIFAFFIRLCALNQSLWLDEAVVAKVVKTYNFIEIVSKFSPHDFHPPIYYLFMRLWTVFFGYSEISLRLPSVIFSLLAGYFVYKTVKFIGSDSQAIWSAVLFLFNPLIVYYSQEARMYMLAVWLLSITFFYFIKVVKHNYLKDDFMFGFLSALSFLMFYGSIFFSLAMILYLFLKKKYRAGLISSSILVLTFLLISPLLLRQLINAKISLTAVKNWSLVLGKSNLKNFLLVFIKFSVGRISFYPKVIYWLLASVWTTLVFIYFIKNSYNIFGFVFWIALSLVILISFFTPMLQYFRVIYLILPLSIVLGLTREDKMRIVLAGGFVLFSLSYLLLSQFHREDWRSLDSSLPINKPVYIVEPSSDPLTYYKKNIEILDLRKIGSLQEKEKDIVVIPYTADIYGLNYSKTLQEKGFVLVGKKTFRKLNWEEWKKSH